MTPMHRDGSGEPAFRRRLFLLAQTTYAIIHTVIWAFGAAVLLFVALHWPEFSSMRSRAVALSEAEMANEDRMYCEKWGMQLGTHGHTLCTLDLKQLRADHERRLQDDAGLF